MESQFSSTATNCLSDLLRYTQRCNTTWNSIELAYLHAVNSWTIACNGGNVIVLLGNWEASHGFEASEWSHRLCRRGTVHGGHSCGGNHRGHFFLLLLRLHYWFVCFSADFPRFCSNLLYIMVKFVYHLSSGMKWNGLVSNK